MTWRKQAAAARRVCLAAAFLGIMGSLGGCSSVPDAVNPVSWYRGVRDTFSSDDSKSAEAKAKAADQPVPNADKPYPSLGAVPDKPPEPSTATERAAAAKTLTADSADARYTDMEIRRQTDESAAPPPSPAAAPSPKVAVSAPPGPAQTVAPPPVAPPPSAPLVPPIGSSQSAATPSRVASAPLAPPIGSSQAAASAAAPPPASSPPAPPPRAAAAPRQLPPGPIPQVPAAPPPMPQMSAARPPPLSAPQPMPSAPPPQRRAGTLEAPLVFGPPPPDIAIAQAGALPAPARSLPRPPRARTPVPPPRYAQQYAPPPPIPGEYQGVPPASPYGSYFPPGVPSVPAPTGYGYPGGNGYRDGYAGGRLASIYFRDGSSRLGKNDIATIRRAIGAYQQRGGTIVVIGHASSGSGRETVRREMANFSISLDRANAVAREIMRLGVDPSAVQVRALSDAEPAYYESGPGSGASNRRADILIE